jgi:hypothetical protein
MPKGNNGDYSMVEREDAQTLGSGNSKLIRSMFPIDGANICDPRGICRSFMVTRRSQHVGKEMARFR